MLGWRGLGRFWLGVILLALAGGAALQWAAPRPHPSGPGRGPARRAGVHRGGVPRAAPRRGGRWHGQPW